MWPNAGHSFYTLIMWLRDAQFHTYIGNSVCHHVLVMVHSSVGDFLLTRTAGNNKKFLQRKQNTQKKFIRQKKNMPAMQSSQFKTVPLILLPMNLTEHKWLTEEKEMVTTWSRIYKNSQQSGYSHFLGYLLASWLHKMLFKYSNSYVIMAYTYKQLEIKLSQIVSFIPVLSAFTLTWSLTSPSGHLTHFTWTD